MLAVSGKRGGTRKRAVREPRGSKNWKKTTPTGVFPKSRLDPQRKASPGNASCLLPDPQITDRVLWRTPLTRCTPWHWVTRRVCHQNQSPWCVAGTEVWREKSWQTRSHTRCPKTRENVPPHRALAPHADGARELLQLFDVHGCCLCDWVGGQGKGQPG